jgi:hypothetical protein
LIVQQFQNYLTDFEKRIKQIKYERTKRVDLPAPMQNVIMAKVSVQKEFDENITAAKWIVKGSLQ